jgi:hypothetical protein
MLYVSLKFLQMRIFSQLRIPRYLQVMVGRKPLHCSPTPSGLSAGNQNSEQNDPTGFTAEDSWLHMLYFLAISPSRGYTTSHQKINAIFTTMRTKSKFYGRSKATHSTLSEVCYKKFSIDSLIEHATLCYRYKVSYWLDQRLDCLPSR